MVFAASDRGVRRIMGHPSGIDVRIMPEKSADHAPKIPEFSTFFLSYSKIRPDAREIGNGRESACNLRWPG